MNLHMSSMQVGFKCIHFNNLMVSDHCNQTDPKIKTMLLSFILFLTHEKGGGQEIKRKERSHLEERNEEDLMGKEIHPYPEKETEKGYGEEEKITRVAY